ncbi:MAG: enoyl-CoA hydratase/carnithine racemase [Alphaproteobacteria bacterium]
MVGPSFAKEIFFTARQFDAEEARIMGLVNRVLPEAELESFVDDYAQKIAENAPLTIAQVKLTVGEILKDPDVRDLEACEAAVNKCFDSSDYVEGRQAFMAKKSPQFTGS